jgi:catechol 2,3-dioxygenase-like lactoylglutathione lyase family enzyme
MRPALVHVGVRATDLAETLRFWQDGLGLAVVQETNLAFLGRSVFMH